MRSRAFLVVSAIGLLALVLGAGAFAYSQRSSDDGLHAVIAVTPAVPEPGSPASLDCSGSSGTVVSCAWTVDGVPIGTSTPSEPLAWTPAWGSHEVGLTITDDSEATDTATQTVAVDTAPVADAGGPYSYTGTGSLELSGSMSDPDVASGDTLYYFWSIDTTMVGGQVAPAGSISVSLTAQQLALLGLGLGPHTVWVDVVDSLGVNTHATSTLWVVPSVPTATAEIFRQYGLNFGSSVDSVSAGPKYTGGFSVQGRIWNHQGQGALPVTAPTVSLDGYDHGQWTFTPDPGSGPWSVGPGPDLGPDGILGLYVLDGWNPDTQQQASSVQSTPVTTPYDASRSFDTTTIPTGGGDQVVTVTVTLQAASPLSNPGGWLNLSVSPNGGSSGAATVVTDQVTTSALTHGEVHPQLDDTAQVVTWTIGNPVVGQTYVLTARVHVPNPGSPFQYKAPVGVNYLAFGSPGSDPGVSATTMHDDLLGGTWTFGSSGLVDWQHSITNAVAVNFAGTAPLAVSVDQPSVTVTAGRAFTETITTRALTGFTGQANFGLSGAPDANGNPTPPMSGLYWNPLSVNITGSDPVTATADIRIDNSVAPGQYTIFLQTWGQGVQAVLTPIVLTVTQAVPQAHASVSRMQQLSLGNAVDSVSATATHAGFRQWRASINNNDQRPGAAPVTGPTISLDGYDHGQWTFTPDPGPGPYSVGPGPDLGQGSQLGLDTLNGWNPTTKQPTSQVQNVPVTTGFAASRSFDTTTIPSGGGDQVVIVSMTQQAPLASGGWLHLNVSPNNGQGGNATVVSYQTSLLTHGELSWLNDDTGGVHWNIGNATVGETYVLTVRVHVPNAGAPFPYKAQAWISTESPTESSSDDGVSSTTIHDALLGGTWTFGSSSVADWQKTTTDSVQVGFGGVSAPVLAVSLDQPAVTVPAGGHFTENITLQALTGLTGQVGLGLSGEPDANGNSTPPMQGIGWNGPFPWVTIGGPDPVTTAVDYHLDRSIAPGQYTIYVQACCLGGGGMPTLTPIALTVTPVHAAANASAFSSQSIMLPPETDALTAIDNSHTGSRQFSAQIQNWQSLVVPSPAIGLDGYDHGRWTFTPDPGPGPYTVTGADLNQNEQLNHNILNGWDDRTNTQTSQVEDVPFVSGFDLSRTFDTTTIPPGGGNQTVTVSITPKDLRYSGGGLFVGVGANDMGGSGAAIDVASVTTTSPGGFTNIDPETEWTNWSVGNVSVNATYSLTLRIHVPNAGTDPIEYKPMVKVGMQAQTWLPEVDGATSTTIADNLLGGTWTFSAGIPVDWQRWISDGATVGLRGIPVPQLTASISDPTPTVSAGWSFAETLTITPLNGFSGHVDTGLCGSNKPYEWNPAPDGFQQTGPGWDYVDVSGPTSVQLQIAVDSSVAPGDYTFDFCLGLEGPPVFVPIHVTVTEPGPVAHAGIFNSSNVSLPSSVDTVEATTPFGGLLDWGVGVQSWDSPVTVPGVTIDLPTGKPPASYPLHEGPQDVTQDNGLWLPLDSVPLPGFTSGMDITRSVAGGDWAVSEGGVQTVTITVTPRVQSQGLDINLAAGDQYGPPYGTFGTAVTSGAEPDNNKLDQSGGGVHWSVWQPEVGQTYTLTVPITASTAGTFKPAVSVNLGMSGSSTPQVGTTVSLTDADLGGTVTFSAAEAIQWWLETNHNVDVELKGVSPAPTPPPAEVTVESQNNYTNDQGIPVVLNRTPTTFTRDTAGDCADSKPVQAVHLTLHPTDGDDVGLDLAPTGVDDLWSGAVTLEGTHGYTTLTFDVTCSDKSVATEDGGSIFIDPSGTIVDTCTEAPVEGATATLQTETADGVFEPPLAGSFVPAANPETTGADGTYGWDVLAGLWRVRVEAPGYQPVDGPVLTIPPAVTDLTIELTPVGGCHADTTPPVIASHDAVTKATGDYRGVTVQYTPPTATDDTDGTVPVTCSPAPGSHFPLGTTTVGCTATDAAGNAASGSFDVVVKLDADLAFAALTADIKASSVKKGLQQELTTKLTDAAKELGKKKPNVRAACHKLDELDKTLASKVGKEGLTAAQAAVWRDWAKAVAVVVGC